jgi:hypothetical protein
MQNREFLLVSVPQPKNGNEYGRVKQACCQVRLFISSHNARMRPRMHA